MDETLNMNNQGLDRKEPEQNQGGILRRLRDRDLLRKRKAEAEEKETNQVESKRRRARGEKRSGIGKRGRPRKAENLPEVLPIQEESVKQVPQPPAEESLPEAAKVGPAQTFDSPLLLPAYVPAAPAPLLNVASVQAPVVASSSTCLFPLAPTPTPTPAPTPTLAPNVVPDPTVPTPNTTPPPPTSTQSPPLPAPSGQSQTETPSEAPVSAQPPLAPAPAPAPSALVYTTESSTSEALGQVTIEDLGPDELEDASSPQKEVAIQRFDTDSVEGPSPPVADQGTVFSSTLLTSLPATQGYFTEN